jgi:hypothetical protein
MTSTLAKGLAVGRVAFGAALVAMPEEAARGWIGRRAASYGGAQALARALGVRDLVLGVGSLAALSRGDDARGWVLAGAVGDAVDLVASVTGDDLPATGRIAVLGLASAAIAVSAAYAADRSKVAAQ